MRERERRVRGRRRKGRRKEERMALVERRDGIDKIIGAIGIAETRRQCANVSLCRVSLFPPIAIVAALGARYTRTENGRRNQFCSSRTAYVARRRRIKVRNFHMQDATGRTNGNITGMSSISEKVE